MSLRVMKLKDMPEVVNLYKHSNPFSTIEDIREWTKKGLYSSPSFNLVYEKQGVILGSISAVEYEFQRATLNDIAVKVSHRRNGIGTKLMMSLLRIMSEKSIKHISAWVHRNNHEVLKFYFNFDFEFDRFEKTKSVAGIPDGEDFFIIRKHI